MWNLLVVQYLSDYGIMFQTLIVAANFSGGKISV